MNTNLKNAFSSAGLPQPPVPEEFASKCQQWGEWTFGTTEPQAALYECEAHVTRILQKPDEQFLSIGHTGYGVNNWSISYYTNLGDLAILLQVPWGGAFADEEESREEIKQSFEQIEQLLSARDTISSQRPGERLIVIHDETGSSRWGWCNQQPLEDVDILSWEYDNDPFSAALKELTMATVAQAE